MSGWLPRKSSDRKNNIKENTMNLYDDEIYDHKMEEIVVHLEYFLLDVMRVAAKRLIDNNADLFLSNKTQTGNDDF
jgi:hypothetical protein